VWTGRGRAAGSEFELDYARGSGAHGSDVDDERSMVAQRVPRWTVEYGDVDDILQPGDL